ncbi:MAG: hypothetical protein DMG14_06690 [Acidobacteria bacterium]|nr:MAG: hypothetical protein DMG14_06690 [Acidobacteriota bacterium]
MNKASRILVLSAAVVLITIVAAAMPIPGMAQREGERLILSGDLAYFFGPGKPLNCTLNNRYKRGDPVGFRMTAVNPATGKRDRRTQLVVHLTYGGKTIDLPMRDRQTEQQPEREFWVLKWVVPNDAPLGIVRYTVTAKDSEGRTGEWKPFDVEASQLTIVE